MTLVAAAALMAGAATLASWIPARRAARTDPALVLKGD
jgi:ABC-type lipoprotein release transport system permease subunit